MVLKYIYLPGLVGSQTFMPHCQPSKFHELWATEITGWHQVFVAKSNNLFQFFGTGKMKFLLQELGQRGYRTPQNFI